MILVQKNSKSLKIPKTLNFSTKIIILNKILLIILRISVIFVMIILIKLNKKNIVITNYTMKMIYMLTAVINYL